MALYFHGTSKAGAESIRKGIRVAGKGFHLTLDPKVAANYGAFLVVFKVDGDFDCHQGMINKEGNFNAAVGNGIEFVLRNQGDLKSFMQVLDKTGCVPSFHYH